MRIWWFKMQDYLMLGVVLVRVPVTLRGRSDGLAFGFFFFLSRWKCLSGRLATISSLDYLICMLKRLCKLFDASCVMQYVKIWIIASGSVQCQGRCGRRLSLRVFYWDFWLCVAIMFYVRCFWFMLLVLGNLA